MLTHATRACAVQAAATAQARAMPEAVTSRRRLREARLARHIQPISRPVPPLQSRAQPRLPLPAHNIAAAQLRPTPRQLVAVSRLWNQRARALLALRPSAQPRRSCHPTPVSRCRVCKCHEACCGHGNLRLRRRCLPRLGRRLLWQLNWRRCRCSCRGLGRARLHTRLGAPAVGKIREQIGCESAMPQCTLPPWPRLLRPYQFFHPASQILHLRTARTHGWSLTCNCLATALCTLIAVDARLIIATRAHSCSCAARSASTPAELGATAPACSAPSWAGVGSPLRRLTATAATAVAAAAAGGATAETSTESCCLRCTSSLNSSPSAAASEAHCPSSDGEAEAPGCTTSPEACLAACAALAISTAAESERRSASLRLSRSRSAWTATCASAAARLSRCSSAFRSCTAPASSSAVSCSRVSVASSTLISSSAWSSPRRLSSACAAKARARICSSPKRPRSASASLRHRSVSSPRATISSHWLDRCVSAAASSARSADPSRCSRSTA
eukprot:scaffold18513_cov101-Isochrysis_galbana.AAC.7